MTVIIEKIVSIFLITAVGVVVGVSMLAILNSFRAMRVKE